MAISKIKKIRIIFYQEDKDRLVKFLQNKGLIQIISTKEFLDLERISISTPDLKENLENIKEALDFLKDFTKEHPERIYLTEEEFKILIERFDYSGFLKELNRISKQIEDLNSQKTKLIEDFKRLILWKDLDLDLEYLSPTLYTESLLGFLSKRKSSSFLKEIDLLKNYLEVISEDKLNKYILIIYLFEDKEKFFSISKKFNFSVIDLPYKKGRISDILRYIQEEIESIDKKISSLEESLKELAHHRFKLMAVYDYLLNIKGSLDIQGNFKRTTTTFLIEGWVRDRDIEYLKKDLVLNFRQTAIFVSDPDPKEKVPVALENKRPFKPFEVVTNLYGRPLYGWIDPTPYLAIFFVLSLSFCLTDAGYGILLTIGSYLVLKKFRLGETAKKFLWLFLICGLFTIITGAITGSWFGNLLDKNLFLRTIKYKIMLFDPLKKPLNFLFLSLGFGFLQIIFGLSLRFFKEIKNKLYFSAIFKELPSILIQISLLFLVLIFFKILPLKILLFPTMIFIFGSLLIIFYQFKIQREFTLKLFWSIYGLYGIVAGNFLADTLSFCRIFALGLTTSLLATAINEIYFIFPGILRLILIPGFILAHILNLGINLLGAYVHTSRLQYLEFFTKFFEAQEEPFKPFGREFKFVQLEKGG